MDIIIGSVWRYGYDQIKYWLNSILRSGFDGEIYLACCEVPEQDLRKIKDLSDKIKIVSYGLSGADNIVVYRFQVYYYLLNYLSTIQDPDNPYRYVIATDVKDVIFQTNPSVWLDKYGYGEIILSSESLRYEDEPWGINNLSLSYGSDIAKTYAYSEIVNCGVLCGEFVPIKDLFLNIYFMSRGSFSGPFVPGGGGPDQAALNILMGLTPYKDIKQVTNPLINWAAQLGTTNDPVKIGQFAPKLLQDSPIFDKTQGLFLTPEKSHIKDIPYSIVHQWDRMDFDTVNIIKEKYS